MSSLRTFALIFGIAFLAGGLLGLYPVYSEWIVVRDF